MGRFSKPPLEVGVGDFDGKGQDDREFYSYRLKKYYTEKLRKRILEIQKWGEEELLDKIVDDRKRQRYDEFARSAEAVRRVLHKIRSNATVTYFQVERMCGFYMDLFREVFADLFAVISLRSSPELYFSAFSAFSRREKEEELEKRAGLYVRAAFVWEVMADGEVYGDVAGDVEKSLFAEWKAAKEKHSPDGKAPLKQVAYECMDKLFGGRHDTWDGDFVLSFGKDQKLCFNSEMLGLYKQYFQECLEDYLAHRMEHREFQNLEERFRLGNDFSHEDASRFIASCGWAYE